MKNKKMIKEIKKTLIDEAKKMDKDIDWFKNAKKTKAGGYRFLANKEAQWKKLEEIAKKIASKYPKDTTGEIVDMISEIVNE